MPNYIIQGTARELLMDTLMEWNGTPWRNETLWPVHDEVLAMVRTEDAEAATADLMRCMTRNLYGVDIVAEADAPTDRWIDAA